MDGWIEFGASNQHRGTSTGHPNYSRQCACLRACVKSHSPCSEGEITVFITILITHLQERARADTQTLENAVAQCGIRIRLTSRSRLVDVLESVAGSRSGSRLLCFHVAERITGL